ncbi:MAG: hypothetical protein DRH56_02460 [Deltaproteobacteria bacterium]|nr:MAG: hypothetical protein DRH56_02460 [Deltaproteobacteria bacterium]
MDKAQALIPDQPRSFPFVVDGAPLSGPPGVRSRVPAVNITGRSGIDRRFLPPFFKRRLYRVSAGVSNRKGPRASGRDARGPLLMIRVGY